MPPSNTAFDITSCQHAGPGGAASDNLDSSIHSSSASRKSSSLKTKKSSTIRKSSSSKSARRETMMKLILDEMADTWIDEEDFDSPRQTSKERKPEYKRSMSAEDLFYAQMNGEIIDGSLDDKPYDGHHNQQENHEVDFNESCGALTLPDVLGLTETEERRSNPVKAPRSRKDKAQRRLSIPDSLTESTRSGSSSSEGTLSMREIQDYVMKNMPSEVRDKIPEDAWSKIFGGTSPDKTFATSMSSSIKEEADDLSVISDITEHTGFQGAVPEEAVSNRELKPEEIDWDEDICPGLDTSNRLSSSGSVGSSESPETQRPSGLIRHSSILPKAATSKRKNLKVDFSHVQVRYYQRILDINPAVTSGPAIGIGWKFRRGGRMLVDDWEVQSGGSHRSSGDLILPRHIREKILTDAGYSQKQIAEAVRITRKAKERRKVTVQNLGTGGEAMAETVEAASRRIMGILSFGRQKGLV